MMGGSILALSRTTWDIGVNVAALADISPLEGKSTPCARQRLDVACLPVRLVGTI